MSLPGRFEMKVLLINPPRVNGYPVVREEKFEHKDIGSVYPPLNLLTLAAMLEKKHDVSLIDANGFDYSLKQVEHFIKNIKPDVMICRIGFDTQQEDLEVVKSAKKQGAITIIRNKIISDVTHLKQRMLENNNIDFFINGELEAVVPALLDAISNGTQYGVAGVSFIDKGHCVTTKTAKYIEDLDSLPIPAYHLVGTLKPYYSGIYYDCFSAVLSSHGCPYGCTFCAYGRQKCRLRSPEHVIKELIYLKEHYGLKHFLFFDDTFTINRERAIKICDLMIEKQLDLGWSTCTRANLIDDELITVMKKAGCVQIAFGVETGSQVILDNIKKGVKLSEVRQAASLCRTHGIHFSALVILGLPGETEQTINETVNFIKEIDPFYTQFCTAIPFPNTAMYPYYSDNNFIQSSDFSKYCTIGEPIVRTEELSTDDLIRLRKKAYLSIVLRPSYLIARINWKDWKWTLFAAGSLVKRLFLMFTKNIIR